MKKWIKRTLWIVLGTLLGLVVLVGVVVAVALNFVFTPQKLTPLVEQVANAYLIDSRLSFRSVELTFFSTFPNFGLRVDGGVLTSNVIARDTTLQDSVLRNATAIRGGSSIEDTLVTDTVVSFDRLDVVINPVAFVRRDEIVVRRVTLDKPRIYAAVRSDGSVNWDIVRSSAEVDSTSTLPFKLSGGVSLERISVKRGGLTFDDRQSGIFTRLEDLDFTLSGDFAVAASDMKLTMSFSRGLLWQQEELVFSGMKLSTTSSLIADSTTRNLVVNDTRLQVNGLSLSVEGVIGRDSVQLDAAMELENLQQVLDVIPSSWLKNVNRFSSTGRVLLNAKLSGGYKNGEVPILDADFSIDGGSLKYDGFAYGIDGLDIDAGVRLDLTKKSPSYLRLSKFRFAGASTRVDLTGRVDNLLGNARIDVKTDSKLDFTELAQTLPLGDSLRVRGLMTVKLDGVFTMEQLRQRDYARIAATGEVNLNSVVIESPAGSIRVSKLETQLTQTKDGLLSLESGVDSLSVLSRTGGGIEAEVSRCSARMVGMPSGDSIPSFSGTMNYNSLVVLRVADSVTMRSGSSNVKLTLSPGVNFALVTDSLMMSARGSRMVMRGASLNLELRKKQISGKVAFKGLRVRVAQFPLPMVMPSTNLKVVDSKVLLENASFRVGHSDITVSGSIANLGVLGGATSLPLMMRVRVESSKVDLNEILSGVASFSDSGEAQAMAASDMKASPDQSSVATKPSDSSVDVVVKSAVATSTPEQVQSWLSVESLEKLVPRDVDIVLHSNFKQVLFGSLVFDQFNGDIVLNKGILRINELTVETLGAQFSTRMAWNTRTSDVGIELKSRAVNIHSVLTLLPSIDTIMPMLASLEGMVDFAFVAKGAFENGWQMNPRAIDAALSIQADSLVVLDGQAFAKISKMLMFKNKKRNLIDSVAINATIDEGVLNLIPFVVQMDRYRVAVGGTQKLDGALDYHVSVLKSPIPFKLGININGSIDALKIGVGKTEYKFVDKPIQFGETNLQFQKAYRDISNGLNL